LPAQSFLCPSLMTTFYFLRFETPATWRARTPYLCRPGTGWPGYTPRHCVPFSLPPTTRRATLKYSTRPPQRIIWSRVLTVSLYNPSARATQNTGSTADEACLPRCCLAIDVLLFHAFASVGMCWAMGRHVTICSGTFNFSYFHP
jgi:hypothetical protein